MSIRDYEKNKAEEEQRTELDLKQLEVKLQILEVMLKMLQRL